MTWNPYKASEIQKTLQKSDLWLSRSRGQNYLIDRNIASKIVAHIPPDAVVFEVGCGLGSLTILLPPHKVYAVDIDHGILSLVRELVHDPHIHWIEGDFLTFDFSSLPEKHLFFLSNLPYSISGEAIRRFLELPQFSEGLVMVQQEFYERMTSPPKKDTYGVFAILTQTFLTVEKLFSVSRNAFFPSPSVDSVVISLHKKENVFGLSNGYEEAQRDFRRFLLLAFGSKRKTILNNLKDHFDKETLLSLFEQQGLSPSARPEELSPQQWQTLYQALR